MSDRIVFAARVVQSRQVLVDKEGRRVDTDSRRVMPMEIELVRRAGGWVVAEMVILR